MKKIPSLGSLSLILGLLAPLATPTARADVYHFATVLNGANEAPPNASPGWGTADIWVDDAAQTMRVQVWFTGLVAGVTASHIHAATAAAGAGTAAVATQTPTFSGFPSGVTFGSYDNTFNLLDAATYRAGFVSSSGGSAAQASAALIGAMQAGKAYLNIHSSTYAAGEIRGFLKAPDTGSTALLLVVALGGMMGVARRNRRAHTL